LRSGRRSARTRRGKQRHEPSLLESSNGSANGTDPDLWSSRLYPCGGFAHERNLSRSRAIVRAKVTRRVARSPSFVFDERLNTIADLVADLAHSVRSACPSDPRAASRRVALRGRTDTHRRTPSSPTTAPVEQLQASAWSSRRREIDANFAHGPTTSG
jgi:hypothetical protein